MKSVMSSVARVHAQGTIEFEHEVLRYTNFHRPTFAIAVEPEIEEDVPSVVCYA